MKALKSIIFVVVVLFLVSCSSTAKFPTSKVTPAAEITAKKKQDSNKNYVIYVTAENLASADRLSPPKNNYSVWIVTDNDGTKNIGQLIVKNAKKATLTATTPFKIREIFITAEDQGSNSYPSGVEISRTTFNR